MKTFIKLIVLSLLLLVIAGKLKAQSATAAVASATIVTPIGLSSDQLPVFEMIGVKQKSFVGKSSVISFNGSVVKAADITISGGAGDTYSISIPETMTLIHSSGMQKMKASTLLRNDLQNEILSYGKQHLAINAIIDPGKDQVPGQYSSGEIDVTLNFN